VPEDAFYRLEVSPPPSPTNKVPLAGILEVDPFRADPLTSGRAMLYRSANAPARIHRLPYTFWMDAPAAMLQREVAEYLRAAKVVEQVVTPAARTNARYALAGTIVRLEQMRSPSPSVVIGLSRCGCVRAGVDCDSRALRRGPRRDFAHTMTLFLIRHGETELGASRVIQHANTPLSLRGIDQADRLAPRVAALGVTRILSSDLRRAEMTAEPIARESGVKIEIEPLLQERSFGDLRGTPYAELDQDVFAPDSNPPNGETWDAFNARVENTWARIREVAAETAGNLAIVTHGLVCLRLNLAIVTHGLVCLRLIAAHLEAVEVTAACTPPLFLANTGLTLVEGAPPWRVTLLNCTNHLTSEGEGRQSALV